MQQEAQNRETTTWTMILRYRVYQKKSATEKLSKKGLLPDTHTLILGLDHQAE
jgi:hypothetical protein